MERLDLNEMPDRPEVEAAIHCARYAIAKGLVGGKRVLDVACGEGYGSYLLKQAGASSVVGVDIDEPTIGRCKENFSVPDLEFVAANAESLSELFQSGEFDVVVSIETIEHVHSPEKLLRGIKHVLKPEGVVVITCPNDGWYYQGGQVSNPFHRTQFSAARFRSLSSSILGQDAQWSLGTACLGFVSSPLPDGNGYSPIPNCWFSKLETSGSYIVAANLESEVDGNNCSYFVGIWGVRPLVSAAAVFPISMDSYAAMMRAVEQVSIDCKAPLGLERRVPRIHALEHDVVVLRDALEQCQEVRAELQQEQERAKQESLERSSQLSDLTSKVTELCSINQDLSQQIIQFEELSKELNDKLANGERSNRILGLRFSAASLENTLLRERISAVRSEWQCANQELYGVRDELRREREEKDRLRLGHDRYVKLRGVIPGFIRRPLVYSYRGIRKVVRG